MGGGERPVGGASQVGRMEPGTSTCSGGEMNGRDLSIERRRYALEAELPGLAELQGIVNASLRRVV